ncbi:TMEM175 family protein [Micromonospora sp. URMC 105]|uniref:TMEM175 family protein n=1 Tax=Micromonospora sp. URMC 105 TaxID=3423413 RepID=UPI003F1A0C06
MGAERGRAEPAQAQEEAALRSDIGRAVGFSDAVFAIIITVLVLELSPPEVQPGGMAHALAEQWPTYLAYVTSYLWVAVGWLNHKGTFHRVRCTDRGLHWWNLAVLFTTALLPFATVVLSRSVQAGDRADEVLAVVLYALVGVLLSVAWLGLYHYLSRHQDLLQQHVPARFFGVERGRALFGIVAYAVAALVGALGSVPVALGIFLLLPVFYALSSNGFYDLRRRMRRPG